MLCPLLFAALALSGARGGGTSLSNPAEKKLVYYGWGMPDTQYLRDHCSEMEGMPFDGTGVVVSIDRSAWSGGRHDTANRLGWVVTGKRRFAFVEVAAAVEDLENAGCRRFTDNFLEVVLAGSAAHDLGWFDDQRWQTATANLGVVAKIAKNGGLRGLVFDPEHYGPRLFDYQQQRQRFASSFGEYREAARRRGRQIGVAITAEFPDVRLLSLWAYTLALKDVRRGRPLDASEYALLPAFYDGLLETLSSGAELIDGYEFSYPFKRRAQFADAYGEIHDLAPMLSTSPEAYRSRVRAAFGLWFDYRQDPGYFRPEELEGAVSAALRTSDCYVWLYSETVGFFPPRGVTAPAIDAIARGRAAASEAR